MIRQFLRNAGLLVYAQHFRERYFPAKSQIQERTALPERTAFYRQFIKPGNLCFDVGANIGNRTKVFLELGARVVAVEPQAECAKRLRLRFGSNISLITKALGAKEDEGVLFVSESSVISSLSKDWIDSMASGRFSDRKWNKQVRVRITTLNELIRKFGLPQFCKIDVEGFEEEVLKGLSSKIPYLSLEYAAPEKISNIVKCFEQLRRIGPFTCNYTVGEKMKLELSEWVEPGRIVEILSSFSERKFVFGDVYVKFAGADSL